EAIGVSADLTVDMTLDPGIVISGHVRDAGGVGIGGVGVSALATSAPKSSGFFGTGTAPDGSYSFAVPPDVYTLAFNPNPSTRFVERAWHDKPPQSPDPIDLTTQPATPFDQVLPTGFFLSGTVRDASSSAPIAGVF